ncbi:MAG: hypothetical protein K6U11_09875 [bacterium]|nr:hypothetical protein [bacterium]
MNVERLGKILLIVFLLSAVAILGFKGLAYAQNQMYANVLTTQSPMILPFPTDKGVLIDNFEYWDSPRNHGWRTYEPPYPIWGRGVGYGEILTVLDFNQGSRVLEAHMPYSIFLPAYNMQLVIEKSITPAIAANQLWASIRAPLEVEQFALFKFEVIGAINRSDRPIPFSIRFVPAGFNQNTDLEGVVPDQYDLLGPENTPPQVYTITMPLGRNYQDGTWHTISANLVEIIRKAAKDDQTALVNLNNPSEPLIITAIRVFGNEYRLDNIWLLKDDSLINGEPPYLFKIGPQFVQLFQPFEYYCYAKDPDLTYRVFMDIWQNEYEATGVEPDFDYVEKLTRRYIRDQKFSSQNGHLSDPDAINPSRDKLFWTCTVGGWGAYGAPNTMLSEVHIPVASVDLDGDGRLNDCDPEIIKQIPQLWICPYKPCMVDLPTLWEPPYDPDEPEDAPARISDYDPETIPHLPQGTGGVRIYDPKAVAAYGSYLLRLGFKTWPQLARLFFVPQYLEDLVITVRVQDSSGRTDLETFPLTVVNYPVTNHPPKLENLDEQAVEVGQVYRYQMVATDQDWFGPDGSFTADQLNLTWKATIDGLPAFQYGPWSESIINPMTGEITFTPPFEGVFHVIVQVSDSRGFVAAGDIDILAALPGTWLNHRPYIMGDFNDAAPLVIKAGQLFILGPPMLDFHDPDGEELYYSCNIGSIMVNKDGDGVPRAFWTFQTNFPGLYWVQITAFDQRGGWAVSEFPIDVQPWWSY